MPANAATQPADPAWLDLIEPPEVLIALAARQMQEMMNSVLRQHALKLVEWRILCSLRADEILTICDLSELAVVDRTVTSRLVDKLSERGLVDKKALKTDRRFAQISLSDAGRSLVAAAEPDIQIARQKLFRNLPADALEQLNATLSTFISNAKSKR